MQLKLPAEWQELLSERARQAGLRTPEEYVLSLIERDASQASPRRLPGGMGNDWLKKFDDLVARQKIHNPAFDDSRESIYPASRS